MRSSKCQLRECEPRGGRDANWLALYDPDCARVLRNLVDRGEQPVNERKGWVILAIGIGVCLLTWIAFAVMAYLFSIDFAERILR
jgi:hypothetical protein